MTEYTIEQILEWDKWTNVLVREYNMIDGFYYRYDESPHNYVWVGHDCGMSDIILSNKIEWE